MEEESKEYGEGVIVYAPQTTGKLTITRGKTPKVEIELKSVEKIGNEDALVKRLVETTEKLLKKIAMPTMEEGL